MEKDAFDRIDESHAATQPIAQESTPTNWGLWFRMIIGGLIAAAFLTFVFQNTDSVDVNFLGWSVSMAQSILMVLCGVAGVIIWQAAGFITRRLNKKAS